MKILVVGSTSFDGYERIRRKYMSACRQIGEALAKAKHTLVLGSDATNTVERQVLEGYSSVDGRRSVIIVGPQNGKMPFARERAALKDRIDFTYRTTRATGHAGRVHQVMAADGMIILGGGRGEGQMGYSSPALKRPVVAIPSFGGAAKELWEEFEADYRVMRGMKKQCNNLQDRWSPACADLAVQLTAHLVKHNPYRSPSSAPQGILGAVILMTIMIWAGLFFLGYSWTKPWWGMGAFSGMLCAAAFLGSGLRTSLRLMTEGSAVLSWGELLIGGALGMGLAFSFAVLFLASGTLVTFEPALLITPERTDYYRIAFIMTALGLASGLLREKAADRLHYLLGGYLTNPQKGA